MQQVSRTRLHYKQALINFILAYAVITGLAFGLYAVIAAIAGTHVASAFDIRKDRSYLLAEKLYPILNLFVWTVFSWLYFRGKQHKTDAAKAALRLGTFWLSIALPLDLISFVLVKNPLSLSAHDFYIGQFPWIYLTYLVVFISPLCYVGLASSRKR